MNDEKNIGQGDGLLPMVSVIVPAYNYGHVIEYTLDSLKQQSYLNWECIVVDDESTDDTSSVVNSYCARDRRIKYIKQKNGGPSKARNTGLSKAIGKYVQFLDADDLLESRKLEHHVEYLESNPEVDLVYGSARYFRSDTPGERRFSTRENDVEWMPNISGSGKKICEALIKENIMVISAPLIRRSLIDRVGEFDLTLPPVEDWDYWVRCALSGARFHYMDKDETLSLIRWHPGSLSHDKLKSANQLDKLRKKLSNTINDDGLAELIRKVDFFSHGRRGIDYVNNGFLLLGMKHLMFASAKSSDWRESAKWAYSAIVAPLFPRGEIEKAIYSPLKESLLLLMLGRRPHQ
ncbi:MAG: glycosyltransferase family 2 protein [Blastocatellia bacterium]